MSESPRCFLALEAAESFSVNRMVSPAFGRGWGCGGGGGWRLSSQPLPQGSNCGGHERCGNSASAQGRDRQGSSVMVLPTFQSFRKQNTAEARMDLWDGNNEPFITQNETARKNKHTKTVHLSEACAAQGSRGTRYCMFGFLGQELH